MIKRVIKRFTIAIGFFILLVLLCDQMLYTIKTERLSDYTESKWRESLPDTTVVTLLGTEMKRGFSILYYALTTTDGVQLRVLTYEKSALSGAYRLLDDIALTPKSGEAINKSFLVKRLSHKMLVLYGYQSTYNIQVMRNRRVSEFYEMAGEPYYLIVLDDIEHLYFYYESKGAKDK